MSSQFPLTIKAKAVTFDPLPNEWAVCIHKSDGESIVMYLDKPDMVFEQLVEQGDLEG